MTPSGTEPGAARAIATAQRNVEAKYQCADLDGVAARALANSAADLGILMQTDTFFAAPSRLKLREFGDGTAELIAYRRPDEPAARVSEYQIAPCAEPGALRRVLRYALGETAVVRKRRRLMLLRHTRIHLDQVEGLGAFVELETVLDGIDEDQGRAEMAQVALMLGLSAGDVVPVAYADLMRADEATLEA